MQTIDVVHLRVCSPPRPACTVRGRARSPRARRCLRRAGEPCKRSRPRHGQPPSRRAAACGCPCPRPAAGSGRRSGCPFRSAARGPQSPSSGNRSGVRPGRDAAGCGMIVVVVIVMGVCHESGRFQPMLIDLDVDGVFGSARDNPARPPVAESARDTAAARAIRDARRRAPRGWDSCRRPARRRRCGRGCRKACARAPAASPPAL